MSDKVISLLVVAFIIFLCVVACSVSGGPSDDGSAWNCVMAVIVILALLKKAA